MLIKAEQKNLRLSTRKLRLLARSLIKLSPDLAIQQLKFMDKRTAKPLAKVIKQAIGNAVNNKKIKKENLQFAKIEILDGPGLKRFRPVSRGRAHSIKKPTSHIRVVLKTINPKLEIRNPKQLENKKKEMK